MVLEEEIVHVDDDNLDDDDDEVEVESTPLAKGGGSGKSRRRSKIWGKDFTLIEATATKPPMGKCNHCGKEICAKGRSGTGNFTRHLLGCVGLKNHDVKQMLLSHQGKLVSRKIDQEVFKELCAKLCLFHQYSYSFVEHPRFRELCEYLNPDVKHICRNTLKNTIGKINDRERHTIETYLCSLPGRICLTSDMWTSSASQGYISITAHFVDSGWNLHSIVLHLHHLPPPHTASAMHNCVLGLLRGWGIEKKIFSITLDNARTNDNMQDLLCDSLSLEHPLPCNGKYFHVRCGAHVLNLIVQAGLEMVDESVLKLRKATNWIDGSEGRKIAFVQCGKDVGCDFKKGLIRDTLTRWNSTHDMLERSLLYKKAFDKLAQDDRNFTSMSLTENEWYRVERICILLRPFKDITTLFSGSKYPTANLYFKNVWEIELALTEQLGSPDVCIMTMATTMKKKFDKYWKCYSMVLAFAVVLDPRYKMDYIRFCFQKLDEVNYEEKVNNVLKAMEKLFEDYSTVGGEDARLTQTSTETRSYNRDSDFGSFEPNRLISSKSMLHTYLEESRLSMGQLDILSWWKTNEHRFPSVACMARDILAIPITTVASESTFSLSGRILTKYRQSILPENAEALVQTRSWLSSVENIDFDLEVPEPSVEFDSYVEGHQDKRARTFPSSHESAT